MGLSHRTLISIVNHHQIGTISMPIKQFEGSTFVAFLDISGFKELMKDGDRAWNALDVLYQEGYNSIQASHGKVEGLFVSDSGILFTRNGDALPAMLTNLLRVVQRLNRRMLGSNYMLTTSIAYGSFKFQERIEFPGIDKNPIYGNAYVQAFSDNASGTPRIEPGFCRIVRENLPGEITSNVGTPADQLLHLLAERRSDRRHLYFYWNLSHRADIEAFEREYTNAYSLKYSGMLKALKRGANGV